MWCLTEGESVEFAEQIGLAIGLPSRRPQLAAPHGIIVPLSDLKVSRLTWFSNFVASSVGTFDECLLWVTESGVWSSSENLHLFYRLRGSYGERRLLGQAPGHLFIKHEGVDLGTFVELALQFGWDFYLLPNRREATVFVSHDEFLHFHTDSRDIADSFAHALSEAKVDFTFPAAP